MSFTSRQSASILLGAAMVVSLAAWIAIPDAPGPDDRALLAVNAAGLSAKAGERGGANVVAGLGVVEPASGTINLSTLMPGVIASISKAEGDPVKRGEVLAELVNDDLKAQFAQAESTLRIEAARLALIENGPRQEEIAQAEARVREEQGNLQLFDARLERHKVLVRQGAIARETLNETQQSLTVSQERLAAVQQQLDILRKGARPEELEQGRASYKFAQDKLAEAQAMLDKSYVRSTTDGVVLRRYMEPGEGVSAQTAAVILQIGDTSRLVARTQIDENDISHLKIGQRATISAPYLGGKTLSGTVSRISPRLGAKTVTAETPTEKRDTRVLDVIVALDPGVSVPVNLRVDVVIDLDSETKTGALSGILDAPLRLKASPERCLETGCAETFQLLDDHMVGSITP